MVSSTVTIAAEGKSWLMLLQKQKLVARSGSSLSHSAARITKLPESFPRSDAPIAAGCRPAAVHDKWKALIFVCACLIVVRWKEKPMERQQKGWAVAFQWLSLAANFFHWIAFFISVAWHCSFLSNWWTSNMYCTYTLNRDSAVMENVTKMTDLSALLIVELKDNLKSMVAASSYFWGRNKFLMHFNGHKCTCVKTLKIKPTLYCWSIIWLWKFNKIHLKVFWGDFMWLTDTK